MQGTIIKRVMGINKRSHHSNLLRALNITPIDKLIGNNAIGLYHRIYKVNTLAKQFQSILLTNYILSCKTIRGTLLDRVVAAGHNPLDVVFNKPKQEHRFEPDGVVDSLKYLLNHDNYTKPGSDEHILATLLTKAF